MQTPPSTPDPTPSSAPQPGPQNAGYPPVGPSIRFEVIGQAFNMVFADLGTWAVAALIAVIPFIVLTIIGNVLMIGMMMSGGFFLAFVFRFIFLAITIAVMYVMMANMYRMAIIALSGTKPSVNEMLKFGPEAGNIIVASLIVGLCTGIGLALCVIPGLVVGGLMMFTLPLVVDRKISAMEAVSLSIETLKKDVVMASLFFLIISFCASIGAVALGIGIILTWPVLPIGVAMLYRDYLGFTSAPAIPTP